MRSRVTAGLLLALLVGCSCPAAVRPPSDTPLASTAPPTVLLAASPIASETQSNTPTTTRPGRIVFSCCDIDDIYVARSDGTGRTRLTTDPAPDFDPTCSPDGTRIAFRSERDGNSEIYGMNADGSRQANLTRNPAEDWSPAWSPDGQRIAFASSRDGGIGDIFVMNADGSQPVNLTQHAGIDEYPAWSPDGRKIAFSSYRDGERAIYVINIDGSGETQLTRRSDDNLPAWSPDGQSIAFRRKEGTSGLEPKFGNELGRACCRANI